ncbi:MAG: hypothetical protein MZV70_48790 [Desulfobacterales bacterium]|nr:hypothetical protein [Desulfobacterales bacterium]
MTASVRLTDRPESPPEEVILNEGDLCAEECPQRVDLRPAAKASCAPRGGIAVDLPQDRTKAALRPMVDGNLQGFDPSLNGNRLA